MFADILDPVLSPLLRFSPFYAILIISFVVSIFVTLIYKFTTDQDKMKHMKQQMKKYQKEMKKLQSEPDKMMKVQKKAMQTNMEYMKMSMKSTIFTIIPIILIFGWLKASLGFYPILPGEEFNVTAFTDDYSGNITLDADLQILSEPVQEVADDKASWMLRGDAGIYVLEFKTPDEIKQKKVIITDEREYEQPETPYNEGNIEKIVVANREIKPLQEIPVLKDIPWVGGFGWLGTYILLSIIFSISMRKLLRLS